MPITKNPASCRRLSLGPLAAALLLPAFAAACGEAMPERRPADFRLSYSNVAGMLPRFANLYIIDGKARLRYRYDGEQGERTVTVTTTELDALWRKLRQEKFTGIRSDDRGKVYDRGGTTITIEWAGNRHTAQNAGNLFIRKSSMKAWREVRGAVGGLIVRHFRRLPNGAPLPVKGTSKD